MPLKITFWEILKFDIVNFFWYLDCFKQFLKLLIFQELKYKSYYYFMILKTKNWKYIEKTLYFRLKEVITLTM